MSLRLASTLIRLTAVMNALFGLLWALGAFAGFGEPVRLAFDILNWPLDGNPGALNDLGRFTSAVSGGVLVGFAALCGLVVAPAIARGDRSVRAGAVASFLAWVSVDSIASIGAGAAPNVAFNAVFLAIFLAPLLLARFPEPSATPTR